MAHRYPLTLQWKGSTLDAAYTRNAIVIASGKVDLPVSSGPEYAGDGGRWNPEDLLGSALATCHMLTFLALAAKARLEIKAYEDRAEAVLDTVDKITRITEIHLKPTIRVPTGSSASKVLELFEKAHKYCFVANSITCKVIMQPRVVEA